MKIFLILVSLLLVKQQYAQQDFLSLKKRGKNVQYFTKGSFITFQLNNQQWLSGYIKDVRNDSFSFQEIKVRQYMNQWGTASLDTMYYASFKISPKNITAFPKTKEGFSFIKNGALFKMGGAGYALVNIINGITRKEEIFTGQNLTNLGISAAIYMFGQVLSWNYDDKYTVGKKYQLIYVKMSAY